MVLRMSQNFSVADCRVLPQTLAFLSPRTLWVHISFLATAASTSLSSALTPFCYAVRVVLPHSGCTTALLGSFRQCWCPPVDCLDLLGLGGVWCLQLCAFFFFLLLNTLQWASCVDRTKGLWEAGSSPTASPDPGELHLAPLPDALIDHEICLLGAWTENSSHLPGWPVLSQCTKPPLSGWAL